MRIAIVSEYPDSPEAVVGGVQAVVRRLATEMARRPGIEVHVIGFRTDLGEPRREEMEGVHVHRFPATARFGNLTLGREERAVTVRALRGLQPDVVNAHVLGPPALAAADAGMPWVATAHGIQGAYAKILSNGLANRVRAWSYGTMERQALARTKHLIVISPYVREYFGARLEGISTYEIENPVADEFYGVEGPGDPTRIIFTGRLVPLKAPECLLDAAGRLREEGIDFRLRLVGPADDPTYRDSLEDRARSLGLADRVDMPGSLGGRELARELAGSGIFVLPSRQETASVSVMEAMAVGLPVVATDVGGTRHLVAEGESGSMVPPDDPGALAEALARLLRAPSEAARQGAEGRRIATARFRIERVVDRTLEVYEKVASESLSEGDNPLDRESVIR